MKRHGIALAVVLFAAGNAHAALDNTAAQALMQKDGCAACHAIGAVGEWMYAYPPTTRGTEARAT